MSRRKARDEARNIIEGEVRDTIKKAGEVTEAGGVAENRVPGAEDASKRHNLDCRVRACIRILEEEYGVPEGEEIDPLDLLVRTILSQNTSDTNSLRAFANLKRAYGDYEQLLLAPAEDVAECIREGGLAEIKARRIKEVLYRIKKDRGAMEIDFLRGRDKDEAMQYLLSLPGVGPKTASIVLLFAFGMPFMPVDTHVFRVSQRLGLVPEALSPEKAQKVLEGIVPRASYHSFHLNLISHGRRICRARGPKHVECALKGLCQCFLEELSQELPANAASGTSCESLL